MTTNAWLTAVNRNERQIEDRAAANDPMKVRLRVDAPGAPPAVEFLHVLQGADAGVRADALTLVQNEAGTVKGVAIKQVAILFVRDAAAARNALSYAVPASVTRHLVTGLKPSTGYTVQTQSRAGNTQVQITEGGSTLADAGGVLAFPG